jgi:hypothetical protein
VASVMGLLEERISCCPSAGGGASGGGGPDPGRTRRGRGGVGTPAIARAELAEALAAPGDAADAAVQEAPEPVPEARAVKVPVTGSIVPHFGEGMTVEALAPDYRRIVKRVESLSEAAEGVSAKEIASGLGLELVPAKIEGVRSKARRLAERGWLAASPSGRFTPRQSTQAAPAGTGKLSGQGGGS